MKIKNQKNNLIIIKKNNLNKIKRNFNKMKINLHLYSKVNSKIILWRLKKMKLQKIVLVMKVKLRKNKNYKINKRMECKQKNKKIIKIFNRVNHKIIGIKIKLMKWIIMNNKILIIINKEYKII